MLGTVGTQTITLTLLWLLLLTSAHGNFDDLEGIVVKGSKNALYLVKNGFKHFFPDFYTFTQMGFSVNNVHSLKDEALDSIPLGTTLRRIKAPPPFRPDDHMYHTQCEEPDRMVSDLGLVSNYGDFQRYISTVKRIETTKALQLVALGGSITAGGYFKEFVRLLETNNNYTIDVHNHGHGATDVVYTLFCVDISSHMPDVVLIDFSVNDNGHPKLMEALIRRSLSFPSNPIVVIVNLWVAHTCTEQKYQLHSFYYGIPLINICPAVELCFGKGRLPKHISDEYSKTDGVHPWGAKGVSFIGSILYAWWMRLLRLTLLDEISFAESLYGKLNADALSSNSSSVLPPPLFVEKPIGRCTRCDALVDDADAKLEPVRPPVGFRVVTRTKIGYGGFNPAAMHGKVSGEGESAGQSSTGGARSSTKSFKRSWQADTPGSEISFQFFGTSIQLALWQRRDEMGILTASLENEPQYGTAEASGFFRGYSFAMERNNTGRSQIVKLFEGLEDKLHTLRLVVSHKPANPWVPGHCVQIFAILSSSNSHDCKSSHG